MKNIIAKIVDWFKHSESKAIDKFLESKYPKSAADIEHWVRVYQRTNKGGLA